SDAWLAQTSIDAVFNVCIRETNSPDFRLSASCIDPFHDIFRSVRSARARRVQARSCTHGGHGSGVLKSLDPFTLFVAVHESGSGTNGHAQAISEEHT